MNRRLAANHIVFGENVVLNGYVEIDGNSVVRIVPLQCEEPFVEWLGGTINIEEISSGKFCVYHNGNKIK